MTSKREYPEQPLVGVGGVVIDNERALLIRRGGPPMEGQWSIPGGMLELGETLTQGVARELVEETGLNVNVLDIIEVLERIFPGLPGADGTPGDATRPQYHFVIIDYLCEARGGTLCAEAMPKNSPGPGKTNWRNLTSPSQQRASCEKHSPWPAPAEGKVIGIG